MPGRTAAVRPGAERVRLSFRLSRREAALLAEAADEAGIPVGTFVAGLAAGVPVLINRGQRADHLQALVASNAEMATLARNIHHLTTLLRQGNGPAVLQYLEMVRSLERDVRRHLEASASVLTELMPARRSSGGGRVVRSLRTPK